MNTKITLLLLAGAIVLAGCASHKESPPDSLKSREEVSYFDRNGDQIIDREKHHYRGVADADWELCDDDFDGRYDRKILYGFGITEKAVSISVPKHVRIETGP